MNIKLLVFDLDGTLVSSHKTIYQATVKTLEHFNINVNIPEDKFYEMIGWHFEDIFNEFGFKVNNFEEFINVYKSIYFDYINYSHLYEGVENTLTKLKDKFLISLLTTKGQDQAEKLVSYFNIENKFDLVMGRRNGLKHKPSAEPLLKICEELNVDAKETIIIGDTELDIQCGKNADAKTCAVTYGYRTKKTLEELSPDYIVDKIEELVLILNENIK
ncbi:MAG: HAD family hydrolase [Melioribacteraceae bacterium]|nr:HAD family hydrolase [Melioribacteraceae bacterium]